MERELDMVATIVAHDGLGEGVVNAARDALANAGLSPAPPRWIDAGEAVDLPFRGSAPVARAALDKLGASVDSLVLPVSARSCGLFVADMDSTMITVECIDELADYAGLKAEISAVTERAMRGELDFAEALHGRVALLKGLAVAMIDTCRDERVRIMPGARTLVQTLKARGAYTLLVSGGFTPFAVPVAAEIGFDRALANELHTVGNVLAGTVGTPIVDAQRKRAELLAEMQRLAFSPERTLAIGDGANDIPMIEAAGFGVAYHAKPKTRAAADASIDHGDLSVLLHALGVPRKHWVTQ